ncbi:hypothetical protein D3C80_1603970 [compost metagenome]
MLFRGIELILLPDVVKGSSSYFYIDSVSIKVVVLEDRATFGAKCNDGALNKVVLNESKI